MKLPSLLPLILLLSSLSPSSAYAQGSAGVPLPGDLTVATSAGGQELPAIARGANGYLVVWEDDRAALGGFVESYNVGPNSDIYAARLDANGVLIDSVPIVVGQGPYDQAKPRVAWNGENYLVVWQSSRATQFFVTKGIYAARVSAAGVLLDTTPIVIEDTDDFEERDPVVASDGTNWMVLYNDFHNGPSETLDGVLVHPLGFVMAKQTVLGGGPGQQKVNCDVAFGGGHYLVVYERGYQGSYGRFVDTALNPTGSQLTIGTGRKPEVASNGTDFFVSFQGARGTPIDTNGNIAIPGGASYVGSGGVFNPETDCAWDGTNWVIAFTDLGFGGGALDHLWLSRVSPTGQLVSANPTAVAQSPSVRAFALANGNGASQVIWDDWSISNLTSGASDLGDLFGTQVDTAGVATPTSSVTVSAPSQVRPVIAGSEQAGYLVAFLSLDSGVTRVCAQRLTPGGIAIDAQPTVLTTGTRKIRTLDLAFNGTEWLAVWDDNFGNLRHTFGVRIAADGSVLDAQPINLLRGERPSVDALEGSRTFLLVSWDHNQSNEYIRGTRVDGATGTALDAPYFTLNVGSGFPDVLGFDDRWLVVWGGISGMFVDASGTPGAVFFAAQGLSEGVHGLARDGDMALLAFQYSTTTSAVADIHARRILKDGTLLDGQQGFPVCQANNLQLDPRAAFDGQNFRVSWTDYRAHSVLVPGLGDVYSALIQTDGTVLQLCGTPSADDVRIPEGDASIVAHSGFSILAEVVLHAESPFGGLRIEIRTEGTPPTTGTPFCFGDGSGTTCGCGNLGGTGEGCSNSSGAGAKLTASGPPSVQADVLEFEANGLPASIAALLFQGTTDVAGGQGALFGDGLRCAGGSIRRLGVVFSSASGSANWGPGLAPAGQWSAGQTLHFQAWYRDPSGPCSTGFNTSGALRINMTP